MTAQYILSICRPFVRLSRLDREALSYFSSQLNGLLLIFWLTALSFRLRSGILLQWVRSQVHLNLNHLFQVRIQTHVKHRASSSTTLDHLAEIIAFWTALNVGSRSCLPWSYWVGIRICDPKYFFRGWRLSDTLSSSNHFQWPASIYLICCGYHKYQLHLGQAFPVSLWLRVASPSFVPAPSSCLSKLQPTKLSSAEL
jgi:hypothetical protein